MPGRPPLVELQNLDFERSRSVLIRSSAESHLPTFCGSGVPFAAFQTPTMYRPSSSLPLVLLMAAPAFAQDITTFGPVTPFGPITVPSTWTYDGATSVLSGPVDRGNVLFGTFSSGVDFSQANQIRLTADVVSPSAPGDSFLFTLMDQSGTRTSALFTWEDFLFGATVTRSLTPTPSGSLNQVNYWEIRSINHGGPFVVPFSLSLTQATAVHGTLPPAGLPGPTLTGFGNTATASGAWSYDPSTSHLTGTPGYGDLLSGNLPISSISGAVGISLTASAATAPSAPFVFELRDTIGGRAYAAFNWASFAGGPQTVTSELIGMDNLDLQSLQGWAILSGSANLALDVNLFGASLTTAPGLVIPEPAAAAPVFLAVVSGLLVWRARSRRER